MHLRQVVMLGMAWPSRQALHVNKKIYLSILPTLRSDELHHLFHFMPRLHIMKRDNKVNF